MSLDLRGKRAHEVEALLDSYLNDASLANLAEARIVHGFGGGHRPRYRPGLSVGSPPGELLPLRQARGGRRRGGPSSGSSPMPVSGITPCRFALEDHLLAREATLRLLSQIEARGGATKAGLLLRRSWRPPIKSRCWQGCRLGWRSLPSPPGRARLSLGLGRVATCCCRRFPSSEKDALLMKDGDFT